MATFTYWCTCGDKFTADAESQGEAVNDICRNQLNDSGIQRHWEDRHSGEEAPSSSEVHGRVAYETTE